MPKLGIVEVDRKIDLESLAQILCKMELSRRGVISAPGLWRQMDRFTKEMYRSKARFISDQMGWSRGDEP